MSQLTPCSDTSVVCSVDCPLCHARQFQPLYRYSYQDKFSHIFECQACGHILMDPIPLVQLNERNMDGVVDAEMWGNQILIPIYEHFVINQEIKYVKKWLPSKRQQLLDIGCGIGWTTAMWQKNGFDVRGIEPSAIRAQVARDKFGLKIFNGHIEEFEESKVFDVILMRHLLEHIEHPRKVLADVKRMLDDEGLLVITIPNINSIGRYLFRSSWAWILPWHLHFYHPKTLRLLLESQGFKVLKLYQMPSPLWYSASFRAWFRDHGWTFLAQKFWEYVWIVPSLFLVFVGFLCARNDNMTVIAQKERV